MRITKISVKGLFGMFDHEIPLNQESRITIVHGPNGVGKTVLLRLVHGLFNYDYMYIASIPFDLLKIEFINFTRETSLFVEKIEENEKLTISYIDHSGKSEEMYQPEIYDDHRLIRLVKQHFPDLVLFPWDGRNYWVESGDLHLEPESYVLLDYVGRDVKQLFDDFPEFEKLLNGTSYVK